MYRVLYNDIRTLATKNIVLFICKIVHTRMVILFYCIFMYFLNAAFYSFPGNYSVAGFELTLRRKVSHYIITYYLPSGMFVIVSWISFLVPPDIVPGETIQCTIIVLTSYK